MHWEIKKIEKVKYVLLSIIFLFFLLSSSLYRRLFIYALKWKIRVTRDRHNMTKLKFLKIWTGNFSQCLKFYAFFYSYNLIESFPKHFSKTLLNCFQDLKSRRVLKQMERFFVSNTSNIPCSKLSWEHKIFFRIYLWILLIYLTKSF